MAPTSWNKDKLVGSNPGRDHLRIHVFLRLPGKSNRSPWPAICLGGRPIQLNLGAEKIGEAAGAGLFLRSQPGGIFVFRRMVVGLGRIPGILGGGVDLGLNNWRLVMYPVLFVINGIPIYAHGFFLFVAILAGTAWLNKEGKRRRWPKQEAIPITLAAFVGGMIGARISIVFFNGWETAPVVLDFYRLFDPRIGPGSILGGVAGAYIAGFIASRAVGKDGCACDAFAPAMALAIVIGRFGCFLSGEDGIGKPTNLPWGVWTETVQGNGQFVHPAPLYDAAFNLIWFGILLALRDHPKMQNGNLLKFGLAGYAVFRFFVEFVRNNRILLWGLTGQQFACILLLLVLAVYYGWRIRLNRKGVQHVLPEAR